jgi:hypothetical protein
MLIETSTVYIKRKPLQPQHIHVYVEVLMPFYYCRLDGQFMSLLTCICCLNINCLSTVYIKRKALQPQHILVNRDINCPSTVYNKRKPLQPQHIHVIRDINCSSTVYIKRKALQPDWMDSLCLY